MRRDAKASTAGSTQRQAEGLGRPKLALGALGALLVTLVLGVALAAAAAPVLTISPASEVSYTTAHLSGTISVDSAENGGQESYYYFQYAEAGSGIWSNATFGGPIAPGSGPTAVEDDLSGLKGGTEYEVRLAVINFNDFIEEYSPEPNPIFTTGAVAKPSVTIDPASSITATTAHFSGTVNPNAPGPAPQDAAFDASWHFSCTPECPSLTAGTVYLKSSDNELPDLVAALHGQIDIDLTGRIDSVRGGIRNTFSVVPDAPVTKFILTMQGGKKGLIVNSRNLCASTNRAKARFSGQNGKSHDFRPPVRAECAKARRGHKRARGRVR